MRTLCGGDFSGEQRGLELRNLCGWNIFAHGKCAHVCFLRFWSLPIDARLSRMRRVRGGTVLGVDRRCDFHRVQQVRRWLVSVGRSERMQHLCGGAIRNELGVVAVCCVCCRDVRTVAGFIGVFGVPSGRLPGQHGLRGLCDVRGGGVFKL